MVQIFGRRIDNECADAFIGPVIDAPPEARVDLADVNLGNLESAVGSRAIHCGDRRLRPDVISLKQLPGGAIIRDTSCERHGTNSEHGAASHSIGKQPRCSKPSAVPPLPIKSRARIKHIEYPRSDLQDYSKIVDLKPTLSEQALVPTRERFIQS